VVAPGLATRRRNSLFCRRLRSAMIAELSCRQTLRAKPPDRLPPPPQPHRGHAAGGAGSRGAPCARNGHTTALFAIECQFFLDNVIAGFGQN